MHYSTPLIIATFLLAGTYTLAQEATVQAKPKTKLESFAGQDGTVIVRGFSSIGTAKGLYGSNLTVECKEFINPSTGKKEYGVTFEVKETSRIERENTSYVDYDEIESLLKGIDYISKVEKSATKLDNFQADYKTKGDLNFSTFSNQDGSVMMAVKSGTIGSTTAYFKIESISSIRAIIVQAKQKLDAIKI